jgi:glycosyltransferase involved in cell wall biosynthesis
MRYDSDCPNPSVPPSSIAFITNICPHYRVKTFETLAKHYAVKYYFFSKGSEWYWTKKHRVRLGNFEGEYLYGAKRGQLAVLPALLKKLWTQDCDVIIKCINGKVILSAAYIVARLRRKPFVLWTGVWQTLQTPFHRLIFPATRFIYRHSDAIVVYGEHVKRYLIGQGVEPSKVFVARHAVDNQLYSSPIADRELCRLRERLHLERTDRVILYVGRLEEEKGVTYLIDAFEKLHLSGSILLLVGDGREKEHLQRLARDRGVESNVRFLGYVSPEEMTSYYALSYVLVLPSISTSRTKEPWGLVVNEAMNQGLPVISTEAVGAAAGGLIQDGVNGFVLAERNSDTLAESLSRILTDPELRDRMSHNARKTIADWSNERMVAGFREAIAFVLR